MILLSFTSAVKYIIGLMLVMLGFIPYEALETKRSQPPQTLSADTVLFESEHVRYDVSFAAIDNDCKLTPIPSSEQVQFTAMASSDSLRLFIYKMENDSTICLMTR